MGFLSNLFNKKERAERFDRETVKERIESGNTHESEQRRPDVDELERRKDVNGLIKALAYKVDWHVRADACWVLGELRDKRAVEELIAALKDEKESVRCRAAGALGKIGDARAEGPLTLALKDVDKVTVIWSLFALYKLGDKSTIDELIAALKDEDETIRVAAALTLADLGDRKAIEPLAIAAEQSEISTFKDAIEKIKRRA